MRLPTKDSTTGRFMRVMFYQVVMATVALVSDPEATKAIVKYYPALAAIVTATAPIASFIYNYFRKNVKNY